MTELYYYRAPDFFEPREAVVDVCIYGGNAAAVVATVELTKQGKSVIVLEPGGHLGGLTAGGLSCTDFGNKGVIGGLSREFYRALGRHYGVEEEWDFEPSAAENLLEKWFQDTGAQLQRREFLASVKMDGHRISSLTTLTGLTVRAKYFIDCSYEGDLMARAGVSYHVGRESNAVYGETLNGVQVYPKHQFQHPVDPYRVEGDPSSGLLPGIDPEGPLPAGTGDRRVQAYNFRMCLTQKPDNKIDWQKPEDYDASDYELLARYLKAGGVDETWGKYDTLRNDKVDKNNHGAVSTDFIGANWDYPEADYATREAIFQAHVKWHQGLFWFLSTDERVPREAREFVASWGVPRDEFVSTGGWPHQLYVREARRMVNDFVVTEQDCTHERRCDDSVGMAAYTMDSHNCRRFVDNGRVLNDGDVQVSPSGPYPISFRAIVPRKGECENLLVPVCMAASHIAYGSIRMEPVFMILGQSSAIAATLALDEGGIALQDLSYDKLQPRLQQAGQVLGNQSEATA